MDGYWLAQTDNYRSWSFIIKQLLTFIPIFVLMKYTFGKEEKLKSRKQIELLFVEGESLKQFPLRIRFLKMGNDKNSLQVAFSVPKRSFKLAVDRNRIKRVLREVYRKNKHIVCNNIKGEYILMFMFTDRQEWTYMELEKKMILMLSKFSKSVDKGV